MDFAAIAASPGSAGLRRDESQRSSVPQRFYRNSQSARTRSPTAQASAGGCINHSARQTSTGFLREYSSAISGFRSLCGQEQRSSFSHRAQLDLRFGTFHSGRALALRTLATIRNISKSLRGNCGASNPGPMLWPERSRSRGIFQAVFLYPNRALWGLFSARDRPPDARQIDLGRPFAG